MRDRSRRPQREPQRPSGKIPRFSDDSISRVFFYRIYRFTHFLTLKALMHQHRERRTNACSAAIGGSPSGIDRVSSPSTLGNNQYGTDVVGERPVPTYLLKSRTYNKKNDVVDLVEVQGKGDYE